VCCAIPENVLVIFMKRSRRLHTSRNRVRFKLDCVKFYACVCVCMPARLRAHACIMQEYCLLIGTGPDDYKNFDVLLCIVPCIVVITEE